MDKSIIFNRPTAHDCILYQQEQIAAVPDQVSEADAADLVQRGVARFADPDLMVRPAASIQKKTTNPDTTSSSLSPADQASPPSKSKPSKPGTTRKKTAKAKKNAQ